VAILIIGLFTCAICILVNFVLTASELPDLPFLFTSRLYPDSVEVPEPQVGRTIIKSDENLQLLWSRSDVWSSSIEFSEHIGFEVKMAAANGILAYIKRKGRSISREVTIVDANNGKTVLWNTDGPGSTGPNKLYATSSALYIGGGGSGEVVAYDLRTGEEFWSRSFPFQRSVTHLQTVNDLVYVGTAGSGRFLLQADTGEKIGNWVSVRDFKDEYFLDDRIFTVDTEFSNNFGTVYATDRQTGDMLWKTDVPVASSNLAATTSVVYLVTGIPSELKLLGVEPRSGKIVNTVTFEPSTQTSFVGPNQITIDKDWGILYVFLGDSRQLFAFKIVDYPTH